LLLLAAGLLVQVPLISAQEIISVSDEAAEDDESSYAIRAAELDAQEAAAVFDYESGGMQGAGPSIWDVIRMVLVLGLVAAAIYGIVFLFKRSAKQPVNSDPFLKVLANTHLGSNRYVHIVSVGEKAWLVGSSEGGVNLISEVEDKDTINVMLLEESKKSAASVSGRFPDFLGMLRRLGTPAANRNQGADEIRKRRERLKGL